jgi:hypothetical protein
MHVNEDPVDPTSLSPGKCKLVPIDEYLASQLNMEQAIVRCYYPYLNVYYSSAETHLGNHLITYWHCNGSQEHMLQIHSADLLG